MTQSWEEWLRWLLARFGHADELCGEGALKGHGQQVKGGCPPHLLCPGEATSGMQFWASHLRKTGDYQRESTEFYKMSGGGRRQEFPIERGKELHYFIT